MIVGIDEVGRGAWAGPLVVGAVLLGDVKIEGLTDSKKLTKKQREKLDIDIRQHAKAIGLGWVSAKHIDQIGLSEALKLASRRALAHIKQEYDEIIIDGTIRLIEDPRVTLMKKADLLIPSVSAASIIAKVARDNYMCHCDRIFPGYKFTGHVGYGTAVHRAAIEELGVTPLHRLSFAPLAKYSSVIASLPTKSSVTLNETKKTKDIDGVGGDVAARYLWQLGHNIIDRNWRTKLCEIDIISRCGDTIYFTEVKYRKNDKQGGGLAAVMAKKHPQMAFAAELYALQHDLSGLNLRLAAIDVSGEPPTVGEFLALG